MLLLSSNGLRLADFTHDQHSCADETRIDQRTVVCSNVLLHIIDRC